MNETVADLHSDIELDRTVAKLAILYADVSGSTRMYEQHGDAIARHDVNECIKILTRITREQSGKVVKTIGDEAMCVYPDPADAAIAACEMHAELRQASELGIFKSGELHVKIGWHYGPVYWRGNDILGEAPITAQQVIRLAKADEILTTAQSLDAIPEDLKPDARLIDSEKAEAWKGDVEIYSMQWEEEEEATQFSASPSTVKVPAHTVVVIEYKGQKYSLDNSRASYQIGRGQDNDVSVLGRFTSRHHAEINYRHGRFHLRDQSTNGTVLTDSDNKTVRLHREDAILKGSGSIGFGGTPAEDPDGLVHFECK